MERKLWGFFTGTHLTIMLTAAILATVPTALWSVDAFNNVAIEDPVSGKKVAVDLARQMFVHDQVADASVTPANFVHIYKFPSNLCQTVYTVPAGKALIIKAINVNLAKLDQTAGLAQESLWTGPTMACPGGGTFKAAAVTTLKYETKEINFGSGLAVRSGYVVSMQGINSSSSANIYGYLVPAVWVP